MSIRSKRFTAIAAIVGGLAAGVRSHGGDRRPDRGQGGTVFPREASG